MHMGDMMKDLSDGVLLINLLEVAFDKKVGKFV
jgi:hypothetical protein